MNNIEKNSEVQLTSQEGESDYQEEMKSVEPNRQKRGDSVLVNGNLIPIDSYQYQNYIPIWIKPTPNQEWLIQPDGSYVSSLSLATSVRKDTVSNMILDLVYVILVYQLSTAFRTAVDKYPGIAIRDLLAHFGPIWHTWMGYFRFMNIFDQNDLVFTLFFLLNLIGASIMGIDTESCATVGDRTGCVNFIFSNVGLRLLVVLGYLYGWYFNPRYHKFLKLRVVNDVLRLSLWFITGFFFPDPDSECHNEDPSHRCWDLVVAFWWISWFADNLQWIHLYYSLKSNYFSEKNEMLPMDTNLIVERNDMFLLISIGEIVTSALTIEHPESEGRRPEDDDHNYTISQLAPVCLIVIISALMKLVLFDLNPSPSPTGSTCSKHALNRSFSMGVIWTYMYMPLNACVTAIGALFAPIHAYTTISYNASVVLSLSFAFLIVSIIIIDYQHSERKKPRRVNRFYRILISLGFSIIMFFSFRFDDWDKSPKLTLDFLIVIVVILMLYVAFIYYSHFPPILEKDESISAPLNDNLYVSSDNGNSRLNHLSKTKYDPCEYY